MGYDAKTEQHIKEVQVLRDESFNPKKLKKELSSWEDEFKKEITRALVSGPSQESLVQKQKTLTGYLARQMLKATELGMKMYLVTGSKVVIDSRFDKTLKDYLDDTLTGEIYPCLEIINKSLKTSRKAWEKIEETEEFKFFIKAEMDQMERCMEYIEHNVRGMKKKDWVAIASMKESAARYEDTSKALKHILAELDQAFDHHFKIRLDLRQRAEKLDNAVRSSLKVNLAAAA